MSTVGRSGGRHCFTSPPCRAALKCSAARGQIPATEPVQQSPVGPVKIVHSGTDPGSARRRATGPGSSRRPAGSRAGRRRTATPTAPAETAVTPGPGGATSRAAAAHREAGGPALPPIPHVSALRTATEGTGRPPASPRREPPGRARLEVFHPPGSSPPTAGNLRATSRDSRGVPGARPARPASRDPRRRVRSSAIDRHVGPEGKSFRPGRRRPTGNPPAGPSERSGEYFESFRTHSRRFTAPRGLLTVPLRWERSHGTHRSRSDCPHRPSGD